MSRLIQISVVLKRCLTQPISVGLDPYDILVGIEQRVPQVGCRVLWRQIIV